jgi:NADH:ubiquinone oxidoreductase subunit C
MSAPAARKNELPSGQKVIVDQITSKFKDKVKLVYAKKNRIKFSMDPSNLVEVALFVRDNLHFDHNANITGTDFPKDNQIQIDYQFGAVEDESLRAVILTLSCRVPSQDPKIPSLINLYPSVDLHERETFEMLGVTFLGHPNLTRLLLPEDWNDIPPMLKKYRLPGRLEGE